MEAYSENSFKRLFKFFLAYRAICITFAVFILAFASTISPLVILTLIALAVYTFLLIIFRARVFVVFLGNSYWIIIDAVIAALSLLVINKPVAPFFLYSFSPILAVAIFAKANKVFLVTGLLSVCLVISSFLSGPVAQTPIANIGIIAGDIVAYFAVGFFCLNSVKSIAEISEYRKAILRNETKNKVIETKLTEREVEVLRLIAGGYDNTTIARTIFASRSTVKNHITSILSKLKLENRTQIAVFAVRNGFVED